MKSRFLLLLLALVLVVVGALVFPNRLPNPATGGDTIERVDGHPLYVMN